MRKENQLQSCCKNSLSSREVVARDLPHFMPLLLLNRKQQPYSIWEAEDPGLQIAGMTPNFMGFTLIELLVVVLIIGILAAIAVPQYQKAVEKSRTATVLSLLRTIGQAQQTYKMANGTFATSFDELDVDVPWEGTEQMISHASCKDARSNSEWSIQLFNAGNGGSAIVTVGRLTGKYTGSGFIYYVAGDAVMPDGTLACAEWTDVITDEGIFCKKVMGSSSAKRTTSNYNAWAL